MGVWDSHIDEEAAFWRSWLSDDRYAEERELRWTNLSGAQFGRGFAQAVGAGPGELLRVLDVGSGPMSTLFTRAEDSPIELVCADPLADTYNALLDEYGYHDAPRIQKVMGEELSAKFGEGSFHYVSSANALDHCEDPAKTFAEMYRVCRPGGLIVVTSVENEGERQHYRGLHQWNLSADDRGLWLSERNLLEGVKGSYSWRHDVLPDGSRAFRVEVRKA